MSGWFRLAPKRRDPLQALTVVEERLAALERRMVRQEEEAIKLATALVERIETLRRSTGDTE